MPTSSADLKPPLERKQIVASLREDVLLDFACWRELAEGTRQFVEAGINSREAESEMEDRRELYYNVLRHGARQLLCHMSTEVISPLLSEMWFDYLLDEIGTNGSLHKGPCRYKEAEREKLLRKLLHIAEQHKTPQVIARVKRELHIEDKVGKLCFAPRR